jgi:hypothetical protein
LGIKSKPEAIVFLVGQSVFVPSSGSFAGAGASACPEPSDEGRDFFQVRKGDCSSLADRLAAAAAQDAREWVRDKRPPLFFVPNINVIKTIFEAGPATVAFRGIYGREPGNFLAADGRGREGRFWRHGQLSYIFSSESMSTLEKSGS